MDVFDKDTQANFFEIFMDLSWALPPTPTNPPYVKRTSVLKQKHHFADKSYIAEVEIRPQHRCSPVNLLHIFRTPFPGNNSGWLLLHVVFQHQPEAYIGENYIIVMIEIIVP